MDYEPDGVDVGSFVGGHLPKEQVPKKVRSLARDLLSDHGSFTTGALLAQLPESSHRHAKRALDALVAEGVLICDEQDGQTHYLVGDSF